MGCKDCSIELDESNTYKKHTRICKQCYNNYRKSMPSYAAARRKVSGMGKINNEQKEELLNRLRNKELTVTKASVEYDLNYHTLYKWYRSQK